MNAPRRSLTDSVADQIREFILHNGYEPGRRLPTTAELASRFQVGTPTVREALRKLETTGAIKIRHGSGIFVGDSPGNLLFANPLPTPARPSRQMLVDLIEARRPVELLGARLAAERIGEDQLAGLRVLLDEARENITDDAVLSRVNMLFHREIAAASGNCVIPEILGVLSSLFAQAQRLILSIYGSNTKDHSEHLAILDALERRDPDLASRRMGAHLDGVRDAILQWNPEEILPGAP